MATNYEELDDEALVRLSQEGDAFATDVLMVRYRRFVRAKTRNYFLAGADRDDVQQEGFVGLFKAIRDFRPDRLASFRCFAELCMTRQIITAIKTATRQKHLPLNGYVSLSKPVWDDDQDRTMLDTLVGDEDQPDSKMLSEEQANFLRGRMDKMLSELEQSVLKDYLDGCSYQEIAKRQNRHMKSIDNALQRIKRKIEGSMMKEELKWL